MPLKDQGDKSMLDWIDDVGPDVKNELKNRYDELTHLQQEQVQMGTSVPQLYGSLSRFIANPSTVSVESYKRMLDTDETIGAGIDFMNLAFMARFGEYTHPNKKIEDFVRRALSKMEGSWHANLDEMFSAEWAGFSGTEIVWEFIKDFDGAPAFVPRKLVTYPPLTMVFAVDRHGEVLPDGIYQYQRFHNTFFNSYFTSGLNSDGLNGFRPDTMASSGDYPYPIRIAADLTYLTVKIPKEKIIHLRSSSTGKFGNPYGRSILRRAYKNWVLKDAFLKMWVVAADRKGTPLVIGYADPNSTVHEGDTGGGQKDQRADVAMGNIMRTIHNSSFIVLPGKKSETYEVEAIQVTGDMNVFKDGIDYFNKALMQAMLIPPLVMSSGDGVGSYALSDTHKKMFEKVIDGKLKPYKQGILCQLIEPLLAYNFPRDTWEKDGPGDFETQEQDPEMMEKLSNVYGNLTTAGYMTPEDQQDMDEVRGKMGLKKKKSQPMYEPQQSPGMDINENLEENDTNDLNPDDEEIGDGVVEAAQEGKKKVKDALPPQFE